MILPDSIDRQTLEPTRCFRAVIYIINFPKQMKDDASVLNKYLLMLSSLIGLKANWIDS